ncbi:hypothetical protein MU1_18200 [Paenibacillus glycanilyticus]|uniref:Transposase n=1 Tax=Paenibacillus glycanilyticus TaxID=126569 RepID=A0ABQ6GB61_9BACL|nr:hypothetical protein MU1_18200 [Paenibacillus glycanilyticus]
MPSAVLVDRGFPEIRELLGILAFRGTLDLEEGQEAEKMTWSCHSLLDRLNHSM